MTTRTHTRTRTAPGTETETESTTTPATERTQYASSESTVPKDAATRTSGTDRAQAMFSHGNTARLENLIDEWNAAFASGGS
ncbi:hypothetical protein [Halopiger xanaduensis]|uniref:Uncharacterized protein n=1 Tax=Halopiger xanaduensis (strain DSM 18323 / JCM 14033 / SH-6) TaxID=797210 RepID=F8D8M7_HALXS|nr:hypothetical protein [Halopiger xanaduensis]AEH36779.1 hypothetical protein Halxa_2154 [Halopiger xanaduensis SH-6]